MYFYYFNIKINTCLSLCVRSMYSQWYSVDPAAGAAVHLFAKDPNAHASVFSSCCGPYAASSMERKVGGCCDCGVGGFFFFLVGLFLF